MRRAQDIFRALIMLVVISALCVSCASIKSPRQDLETGRMAQGPDGRAHLMEGEATWYGERHHGRTTACGEPFDMYRFSAAHRSLPFHTLVRVIELKTRRSVIVRINDRGPYGAGRVIDLSYAAASDLGIVRAGVTRVELEILQWGDGSRCKRD